MDLKAHVGTILISGTILIKVIMDILTIVNQMLDAGALMEINVNFTKAIWKDPATRASW